MKLIENLLQKLGYIKEKKILPPKQLDEAFPFIKKAAALNKKMLDVENKRIEMFSNQILYDEIAILIKKFFKDQNEALKEKVLSLEKELNVMKKENLKLKVENEGLKKFNEVEV